MRINPTASSPGISALANKKLGLITQIICSILDVAFPPDKMPNIYNALFYGLQLLKVGYC